MLMDEIVATEEAYVEDLRYIISEYILPLRNSKFMATKTVNEIFQSVEALHSMNSMMVPPLRAARVSPTPEVGIAQAFIDMASFLKMYGDFCNNQFNSNRLLAKARESDAVRNFLDSKAAAKGGLGVEDYMIKPIQRMCN